MKSVRLVLVKTIFANIKYPLSLLGLLCILFFQSACDRKPIYTELVATVPFFPLGDASNWQYQYEDVDTLVHDSLETRIIATSNNGNSQSALWIISHAGNSDTIWCSQTIDSLTLYRRAQVPNGGLICWLRLDYPLHVGKSLNFGQGNVLVMSKGDLQLGQQQFTNVFELQVSSQILNLPVTTYSVFLVQGIGIIKCSHDFLLQDNTLKNGNWTLLNYTIHP